MGRCVFLCVCPLHDCVSCDRRLVSLEILMDRCSCVCLPRCFHLALLQRHRGFGCAVEVRSPVNLAGSFPRFAFVRVCLRCWLACSLACASPGEAGRLHRGRGFETYREGCVHAGVRADGKRAPTDESPQQLDLRASKPNSCQRNETPPNARRAPSGAPEAGAHDA